MDHDIEGFHLSLVTSQNYPVEVGGYCEKGMADLQRQRFQALAQLRYPDSPDLYQVDALLAAKIKALALPSLCVVGASIHIPGICAATGGILGDPHASAESAGGRIEALGRGFFQLTLPGGPGVALQGDAAIAQQILEQLSRFPAEDAEKRVHGIQTLLEEAGVRHYLIVSDGCGPASFGCVLGV